MKNIRNSLLILLLAGFSLCLNAQRVITGTVLDENNDPLIGASVFLEGSNIGTGTDLDGKFMLEVPDGGGTLIVGYIGYTEQEFDLGEVGDELNITLREDVNRLGEVVISGLASNVKRSNLANAVASVPSAELTGISVPTTTDAALYGKFKGANIQANSGAPGGGVSFRMRGVTSLSGSSQPLIIMDGVYLDNSSVAAGLNIQSGAAGGGSQSNQDNPSNRFADIDPYDIESIEILKGASAAAIYGSRAAGGVVIITTKRGESGNPRINISQSFGMTQMLNPLGVRQWNEERVLASGFADDIDVYREAVSAGKIYDYEDEMFGNTGFLSNTRFSFSDGNEKTAFYVGASYKDEEGIVENTGYNKVNARMNISHDLTKWLNVDITNFYVSSSADRGFFNNDNSGTTMGVSFTSTPSWADLFADDKGIFPSNPYAPSNFLETAALVTNNEKINRYIGGGTATATIHKSDYSSLKFLLRGGVDSYNFSTKAIFPNTVQFQRDGNGLNGISVQGNTRLLNTNLAGILVYSKYTETGINFKTQLGVTSENFDRNTILGEATNLIGIQTNLDQSGSRNIVQTRLIQKDRGFFAQQEVNVNDKFIFVVGGRADKSTNNGDVNKLYFYPKASLAVNIHELTDLGSTISMLKPRVAYGESGNFATFGSKYTAFNSSIVGGSPGVVIGTLRGNSEVGPERQKELEFGIDVGLLENRAVLDITFYNKAVEDLLLNARLPASSGFLTQSTNAAELENRGVEIGLNFSVIESEKLNWNTRVSFWKNTSEVTKLDVPAFTLGGFADFLGNYMIKEGYSPQTIIGVGPNPDVDLNDDGAVMRQIFGNAEPDFQMSFLNTLEISNFDLSFLWHWKQGGEGINLSALLFDLNDTTWDYDDTDLDPSGELANGPYRLSQLGSNTDPYIEDTGYLRLREIGLFYNFADNLLVDNSSLRIGVSANNLINIFNYRSYDPEVSNFGAGGLSTGVEVNPFPSSKRYNFHIQAQF